MEFRRTLKAIFAAALATAPMISADAFDGVTVVNIEKHLDNYSNCSPRPSQEYVWLRFRKPDGTLVGYYRVDASSPGYNSVLSMAMAAMQTGTRVNIRTVEDNWCSNPGYIRALNLVAD